MQRQAARAFEEFAGQFEHESDEWLDKDASELFVAGYLAAANATLESAALELRAVQLRTEGLRYRTLGNAISLIRSLKHSGLPEPELSFPEEHLQDATEGINQIPSQGGSRMSEIIWPMNRENDEDPAVLGYMCLVDFECELGAASGGNRVYPSIEDCRGHRKCVASCGIVEVEVRFKRVAQEPVEELFEDDKSASSAEP